MATRNKMDGVDKENGWRQVIRWDATRHFWGKGAMDSDDKENGRRQERRWMATRHNFLGNVCHGWR